MSGNKRRVATLEAQMLLRAAQRDRKTIELLLQHSDAPFTSIGFHAQQYVEKLIKAVLVSNSVIFRRTHNLEELADLLSVHQIDLPLPRSRLSDLNPFAVTIRYEEIEIDIIDTAELSGMLQRVNIWLEQKLWTDLQPLDKDILHFAVDTLAAQDADLAGVVARFGYPPLWPREAGFPTLLKLILEQQVSLASAQAAYDRLLAAVGEVTPESLLALDDETLRGVGFSRQKTRYGRLLAEAVQNGSLDVYGLAQLDDESVRIELQKITGIGPWTAEVYLLMVLLRPDVWPRGDIALASAAQQVKNLPARPSQSELHDLAEQWRPWRAVAARILWHHYLSS